jgi:hypothetical protein
MTGRKINDGLTKQQRYYWNHREERLNYERTHHRVRVRNWKEEEKQRYAKNPEKKIARVKASIIPLTGHKCLICGSTERLQRAHIDYSKPLEIVFLCEKHHRFFDGFLTAMEKDPFNIQVINAIEIIVR